MKYEYPQLSLLIITSVYNQQNSTKVLSYYSMLMYSEQMPALNTLIFFTVNEADSAAQQLNAKRGPRQDGQRQHKCTLHDGSGPAAPSRNPTTSFLTATTLIYAIGAGITAAAGTRLALQLFLVKGFKLYSFQLHDSKSLCIVIYCHYLPVSGLGNLCACCLPWMW